MDNGVSGGYARKAAGGKGGEQIRPAERLKLSGFNLTAAVRGTRIFCLTAEAFTAPSKPAILTGALLFQYQTPVYTSALPLWWTDFICPPTLPAFRVLAALSGTVRLPERRMHFQEAKRWPARALLLPRYLQGPFMSL